MLQLDPGLVPESLSVVRSAERWVVVDTMGKARVQFSLAAHPTEHWSDLIPTPKPELEMSILPNGQTAVELDAYDQFTPGQYDALGLGIVLENGRPQAFTFSLHALPNECFAGTGERFGKLDLSGRTIRLLNQDAHGVNSPRCYKNVPFFISSRCYGVFIHTSYPTRISFCDYSTKAVQALVEGPGLDVFFIASRDPGHVIHRYRQLTGFPPVPPLWSFGVWMSRMSYFSADEVRQVCRRLRAEGWPADVIHIDTGWFKTNWICDWKFAPDRFPDPAGFLAGLRSMGFRVSLWQLPYVSAKASQYVQAVRSGYIARPKTDAHDGQSSFSVKDYAGTIDLTNPAAVEWYKQLLKELLEKGASCIKADFGEEIHMDASYHLMSAEELRNLYALLYQQAVFDVTKHVTGEGIIWARAGWAGCQRYPVHWAGDAACTWDGMAGTLRGGLHLGLSGFGFWSHDIPGFHGVPDFMNSVIPDRLYVRWAQFGVFTSHMRYHGTSRREPYHYPKVAPIVRRWLRLRYALIPYILEQARQVAESGYPMLRALVFHHCDDPVCWHIDDQYYLGGDILVAPIMNDRDRRNVYLPSGRWVNLFDGRIQQGPTLLMDLHCPLDLMPVWVRFGAQIPVYPQPVQHTGQMDLSKAIRIRFDDTYNGITNSPLGRIWNA
jgi:alpha-D-xyloside xylohydrolase